MLLNDFIGADKYFTNARQNLVEIGKDNQQILENDINVGQMIAKNTWIQNEYKKFNPNKTSNSTSENTNINSAPGTNPTTETNSSNKTGESGMRQV